ncbi:MAG: hypothetical protein CL759_09290 [Chloroflexi bacterium]|nr:hypothetical protein [Chloroflexota bacterium]|tara:strand:- start:8635 stop:11640 length:3006 start_codon:yes stop_codon:yes gene_type:complete
MANDVLTIEGNNSVQTATERDPFEIDITPDSELAPSAERRIELGANVVKSAIEFTPVQSTIDSLNAGIKEAEQQEDSFSTATSQTSLELDRFELNGDTSGSFISALLQYDRNPTGANLFPDDAVFRTMPKSVPGEVVSDPELFLLQGRQKLAESFLTGRANSGYHGTQSSQAQSQLLGVVKRLQNQIDSIKAGNLQGEQNWQRLANGYQPRPSKNAQSQKAYTQSMGRFHVDPNGEINPNGEIEINLFDFGAPLNRQGLTDDQLFNLGLQRTSTRLGGYNAALPNGQSIQQALSDLTSRKGDTSLRAAIYLGMFSSEQWSDPNNGLQRNERIRYQKFSNDIKNAFNLWDAQITPEERSRKILLAAAYHDVLDSVPPGLEITVQKMKRDNDLQGEHYQKKMSSREGILEHTVLAGEALFKRIGQTLQFHWDALDAGLAPTGVKAFKWGYPFDAPDPLTVAIPYDSPVGMVYGDNIHDEGFVETALSGFRLPARTPEIPIIEPIVDVFRRDQVSMQEYEISGGPFDPRMFAFIHGVNDDAFDTNRLLDEEGKNWRFMQDIAPSDVGHFESLYERGNKMYIAMESPIHVIDPNNAPTAYARAQKLQAGNAGMELGVNDLGDAFTRSSIDGTFQGGISSLFLASDFGDDGIPAGTGFWVPKSPEKHPGAAALLEAAEQAMPYTFDAATTAKNKQLGTSIAIRIDAVQRIYAATGRMYALQDISFGNEVYNPERGLNPWTIKVRTPNLVPDPDSWVGGKEGRWNWNELQLRGEPFLYYIDPTTSPLVTRANQVNDERFQSVLRGSRALGNRGTDGGAAPMIAETGEVFWVPSHKVPKKTEDPADLTEDMQLWLQGRSEDADLRAAQDNLWRLLQTSLGDKASTYPIARDGWLDQSKFPQEWIDRSPEPGAKSIMYKLYNGFSENATVESIGTLALSLPARDSRFSSLAEELLAERGLLTSPIPKDLPPETVRQLGMLVSAYLAARERGISVEQVFPAAQQTMWGFR